MIAFAAVLALAGVAPPEARWLAPDADIAAFLSESPGECLDMPNAKRERDTVELGRIAFRSPFLLGGAAARGGLSCNSCHRDGRDNPQFFYEGLSGAPGTADVTSSLFSKSREDGVPNPVAIPDLVDAGLKSQFGTIAPASMLEDFIHHAVGDEFQGSPRPQSVIAGVVAYVGHLKSWACPNGPVQQTPSRDMKDVIEAIGAARRLIKVGDYEASDFMILSARGQLGRINDRFDPSGEREAARSLGALSMRLGAIRSLQRDNPGKASSELKSAGKDAAKLADWLEILKANSLYDRSFAAALYPSPPAQAN